MQTTLHVNELNIPIQSPMTQIIHSLGTPENVILEALTAYLTLKCQEKINQAQSFIQDYEQRYGLAYSTFNLKVTTDELFLDNVNEQHPMWEMDAIEWLYWLEEKETWQSRLSLILSESE